MEIDVVLLPAHLQPGQLEGRAVVVFDVLRATTSMAAAFAVGVEEIRVFGDLPAARQAAAAFPGRRVLCGEEKCLPPDGFDLGNSPGAFDREAHGGRVAFMCTTNGTRAILAARRARALFVGALVNARAVAKALTHVNLPATLLCAGTGGRVAMEDLIGAGAVMNALADRGRGKPAGDAALIARRLFAGAKDNLAVVLAATAGGQNVTAAGLAADIEFAARLDALDVVGVVEGESPVVKRWLAPRET